MTDKPLICCLCQKPIPVIRGYALGNNAQPLMEGRCCNDCDNLLVIPARIANMTLARMQSRGGRK